jgi:hypothetical protein
MESNIVENINTPVTDKNTSEPRILKFIHITKTAGTSIENTGKKHNIDWGRYDKEYNFNNTKGAFWHKFLTDANSTFIKKYDWFTVVRNPYDRIISEYYWYLKNVNIKHNVTEINSYVINQIKKRSMTGNHYTEQYKYVHPEMNIHILKFENLSNDFFKLMDLYKIKINKLEHDNSRLIKKNEKKFTISDFSKELIDLINIVYDKDFKLFNYQKIII